MQNMENMSRRELLGTAALVGGWLAVGTDWAHAASGAASAQDSTGPYTLPPLPYGYADLEPHIDAQTMKLHHDIHHAGYVRGANTALAKLESIRQSGGDAVADMRATVDALSFNLSGHLLHTCFWTNMGKQGGGDPENTSDIGRMIRRDFGTPDALRGLLSAAAAQVQGSGWGVLAYEPQAERLIVLQAEKHNNMLVWGAVPLLVIDVWEHAYYLKYQNKRTSFIKAFWNVVNWQNVDERLQAARQRG